MSATEDTIIEFLRTKARAAWDEKRPPYLLSLAAPDMTDAGIDYREVLAGEKLKAFAERTAGEGRYQFVKHPHQKAKLGLVPDGVDFQFEDSEHDEAEPRNPRRVAAPGNALMDFLEALSKLPSEDLDGVVIPTRVLVKLAQKR